MEEQLKKWQNMWQEQNSNSIPADKLIMRLNQLEKKMKLKRIMLSLLLLALTVACVFFASEIVSDYYSLLSYVLLFIAIFVKLIPLYRINFNFITNESEFNNRNFIKKLNDKLDFKVRHVMLYLFIAILSINSALIGLYKQGSVFNIAITDENRIFFHVSTIVLFILGYFMCKRSTAAAKEEILNLATDLESID